MASWLWAKRVTVGASAVDVVNINSQVEPSPDPHTYHITIKNGEAEIDIAPIEGYDLRYRMDPGEKLEFTFHSKVTFQAIRVGSTSSVVDVAIAVTDREV